MDIGQIVGESTDHQIALARSKSGHYGAATTPMPSVSAAIVQDDGGLLGDCVAKYSIPEEDKIYSWKFTGKEIIPQVSSLAFHRSVVQDIIDDDFMLNDNIVPE